MTSPPAVLTEIAGKHLCCGCGMCTVVCPRDVLVMRETSAGFLRVAAADLSACSQCGLCERVCPGWGLHESVVRDRPDAALEAYWGYAQDNRDRSEGVSGGVVTALVTELLAAGTITGALVVRWGREDVLRPEPIIARNAREIRSAQKSRYCMVPAAAAFDALDSFEAERLAVVGLPCHLRALARAMDTGVIPARSIALRVGLICDRVLSYRVIDALIARAGVARDQVSAFNYRDKRARGWPGGVAVDTGDGDARFLPSRSRTQLKEAHTPIRCVVCADKFNSSADLVVGDAYGYEGEDAGEGLSAVLVRTATGRAALEAAGGALQLLPTTGERLLRAHVKKDCAADVTAFEQIVGFPDEPDARAGRGSTSERGGESAPSPAAARDLRWRLRAEKTDDAAEVARMIDRRLRFERWGRVLRAPLTLIRRAFRMA